MMDSHSDQVEKARLEGDHKLFDEGERNWFRKAMSQLGKIFRKNSQRKHPEDERSKFHTQSEGVSDAKFLELKDESTA